MIKNYSVRTDLALEEKERFESDHVEISGVVLEEDYDEASELRVTRVEIKTENGAKAMGKPVGTYLTIETPNLAMPDEKSQTVIAEKVCSFIKELIRKFEVKDKDLSILVVGLGNREVTPDSLGPCVADHLSVTRHIVKEYGKYAIGVDDAPMISAVVPGVMGQTGMESAEIVRGIVSETNPDVIIAVDALAARNSKRLNRTIQIADTGIHPGSGVGNHRNGMTMETLGVPVIGIGVPTVVDAATIVNDTMENFIRALESSDSLKGVGEVLRSYNAGEKYEFVKELISPHLNGMFVTPKDVDEMVHHISHTLSEAINMLFSAGSGRSEALEKRTKHTLSEVIERTMSDGGSISDIRKRTRTEEADDPVSVFLSGNDLFDFGRNVVGSNVWFPNSYFFGCGRDVHAAACIFEQKPAKNSSRVFYRTILSVSSDSRVCDGA